MTSEVGSEEKTETKEEYDLHIVVPSETEALLKDSCELAYKMNLIEKPKLVLLMRLYIGWGTNLLKKIWLDRVGYK